MWAVAHDNVYKQAFTYRIVSTFRMIFTAEGKMLIKNMVPLKGFSSHELRTIKIAQVL